MNRDAICARWLDAILAGYGEETALRWRKVRDPFANPVGHALAVGLPVLFDAVAQGGEPDRAALEEIVRIRAVQDMPPSRAVGFVFLLRDAIRAEAPSELAALEPRIENLALLAFDAYVEFRERVHRLREKELKRSVSTILRRWYGGAFPPEQDEGLVQLSIRRG